MKSPGHETLGRSVVPTNYRIEIVPGMKAFRFPGRVTITAKAAPGTRLIRLNAKELKIKYAKVRCNGVEQKAATSLNPEKELLLLKFPKPVGGMIEIEISYEGIHNDGLYGFYRSRYDDRGKKGWMLTTQFEAPSARTAIPCFDEPEFKATFDLSLTIDNDLEAISNMPVKDIRAGKRKKKVTFATTPIMSTYLLYMGVGKFERVSTTSGKVKISVITTPGKKRLAALPLKYGKILLEDLQSYFGIRYQLPKLDLIAVPDFAAGAMENWGAITFRDSALLVDEKESAQSMKERIAEIIAHELTHQWFGDLVTMKWWDDMWLNESFATLMAFESVDRIFPEWKMMIGYREDTINGALAVDGMKNTHPISVNVNTVGEIESLFDAIGYNKGGSMLFMLEEYVGGETFRKGLNRYLKSHAYSNATKADLWGAIEEQVKSEGRRMPIKQMMKDWLDRPGYPLVRVGANAHGSFDISQERFTISGNVKEKPWIIPIRYLTLKGEGGTILSSGKGKITAKSEWIKLNFGQSGFYRSAYGQGMLDKLGGMLLAKRLDGLDGWGLENDLFALIRCGRAKLPDYLDFIERYCMESGYPLNSSVSSHLGWIDAMTEGAAWGDRARKISTRFHKSILGRLGWETRPGEDPTDTSLRSGAISALGMLKHPEVVSRALSIFKEFSDSNKKIDPNIKSAVYATVAFNAPSKGLMDKLLALYNSDEPPEDKMRALDAVGELGDRDLITSSLGLVLSGKIRMQDSIDVMSGAAGNPAAYGVYVNWAMANWKRLKGAYAPSTHLFRYCANLFSVARDRRSRKEISSFFGRRQNIRDDIKLEIKKVIERIDANIRFMEANR
jgi:tricorn protease interacting factor F2/3